jgi:hypothetical protein
LLHADGGRFISARFYDHDQIVDAQIDLDRRYYESIGFGPGTLLWDHCGAAYATDPAHVVAILHPDFELSDHRPIVRVRTDRRGLAYAYSVHESGDYVTRPRLLATTARTYAYELTEHVGADYEIPEFIVVSVADGLVRRVDIYATEAEALRRFEELEAEGGDVPELRNSASDVMDESTQVRSRAHLNPIRERFHPEFVGRHRTAAFSAAGDMDRDEYLALIGGVIENGGRFETEVVAIRGDDLALSRLRIRIGEDMSERLVITRLEAGLVAELATYEPSQLTEAQIDLDRRWLESLGLETGSAPWNLAPATYAVDPSTIQSSSTPTSSSSITVRRPGRRWIGRGSSRPSRPTQRTTSSPVRRCWR